MDILIWIGTAITLLGLCGIIWSVMLVRRVKKQNPSDEDMRQKLSKILPVNLAALFVSVLGLMAVIVGISLS